MGTVDVFVGDYDFRFGLGGGELHRLPEISLSIHYGINYG
jgi:hypothetical protein